MTTSSENEELLRDFLTEASDMLDDVEVQLVDLEKRPNDGELLNAVFRGFHTIKGGAGFLDATNLVELCHRGENLLDALRHHKVVLTPEIMDVILAATTDVRRMFQAMANGSPLESAAPALMKALEDALHGELISAPVLVVEKPKEKKVEEALEMPVTVGDVDWNALYAVATGKAVPMPAPVAAVSIENVPVVSSVSNQPAAAPKSTAGAGGGGDRMATGPVAKEASLRIDVSRFDQILNLAGEVGLTKNRLLCLRQDVVHGRANVGMLKTLDQVMGHLDTLVSDLQNAVMKARMQPVGRVFQKYIRMARDLARQLGKDVELQLSGEETELDKTLLDELNDPLVHLIRNAVDHGVESPAERIAAGKSPKGLVTLSAHQAGDSIVIEVSDDGKGIRPEAIRQKAVEKGIIGASEANLLSERESYDIIFLPGFSTKTEISDVSGRGVGMDVVKTNIQRLSGRIEITSEQGRGSRFTIVLPLTLAILPVLVVQLAAQPFALPLAAVREVINLKQRDIQQISGKPSMVIRGEVLPVFRLADLLGWSSDSMGGVGVVTEMAGMNFVLTVDSFVGRDDVVIKPLDAFKPKGVAGATLSREGILVLVLDLRELMESMNFSTESGPIGRVSARGRE
ncbi:MAG: chemotaxis protein CheA [Pseudomonadota bacterium]